MDKKIACFIEVCATMILNKDTFDESVLDTLMTVLKILAPEINKDEICSYIDNVPTDDERYPRLLKAYCIGLYNYIRKDAE